MPNIQRRQALKAAVAIAPLLTAGNRALAQETFPARPVRMITPFAAGGGTDTLARRLIPFLGEGMADRMVVENKPGGNSILATMAVVQAQPDGYTILLQANTVIINPLMQKDLPYDRERDLVPISLFGRTAHALVVSNALPVKSVKELVDYGRQNQGKLNYGTGGIGTSNHIAAELFSRASGVKMEHVAYKGSSEFVRDLIPGLIHVGFPGIDQAAQLQKQGNLKVLATTGATRSALLPDTPTLMELGFAVDLTSWTGYFAPAKTPPAIVQKISRAFQAAARNPKLREAAPTYELIGSTPEQFAEFLQKEHGVLANLLKSVDMTKASAPKS